jgi:hypothetical protein
MACDVKCQNEKKLKTLQGAYMAASSKAGIDPEGYERAKIAYFSLRDGPEWLKNYNQQKIEQADEQVRRRQKQIDDHSPQDYGPTTEDSYEFTRFIQKKQDDSDVKWRTFELSQQGWSFSWDNIQFGIIIFLVLYCIYQFFLKYPKILNYFGGNS